MNHTIDLYVFQYNLPPEIQPRGREFCEALRGALEASLSEGYPEASWTAVVRYMAGWDGVEPPPQVSGLTPKTNLDSVLEVIQDTFTICLDDPRWLEE